ncbi:GEVED domain-containing protein [Lysobacter sp. ESA13C]|uniref:prealbumin-like fold domain-containing protein n=1 Tax=Lysobacter sp. ESA13C TaxID=2862676 RepID=UPI001CBADF7A|nr:GEVED domain-containing protein [Lysobacter sp. ESA13C]
MGNRLRVRNPGQASSNPGFRYAGNRIACLRAALAAAIVGAAAAGPALASEQNPDVDAATGTQTTYISGLVLTAATGGGVPGTSSTSITAGGLSFGGNPPTAYDPRIDLVSETFNFLTPGTLVVVAAGGQQAMGTLTYSFSRPVVNPRFHFARLGGTGAGAGFSSTFMTAPAGSTWTVIGGLLTTTLANTRLRGSSNTPTVACGDPATTSGCGTAQLNGTFTSIPLGIGIGNPTAATPGDLGADGYTVTITVDEDFSDAPTSYGMAGHVNSGLTLGASLTIDPTLPLTIPNGTAYITPAPATSPRASTNAAGDTDNAFASLPIVGVGTYSLSVPVAGFQTVSGASPQLCGWIDFNRNGTFETGERACAGVTGNGNVALNWTIPTGATYVAGESYARLRLGYTTSQVQNATGLADSGEVEDYPITLLPRVRLTKALVPTSDPGLFNLSVAPASATAVQTNSGTVANVGNGGTTDWVPVPLGTLITVSETAGTGTSLSNYTSSIACTDRSGAAVTLGAAGTTRTFSSMVSAPVGPPTTPNSANANLSEISCTATNARLPTLQVVKVTQNGVGTFSFSGSNGIANHDITTVTAGTGVAGPVQLLTAASTATTVSEAPLPAGYLLGGISCSGLGAGGNATVDLPNRSVSLDAAATVAGSAIVCTFTNIAQVADLAITKTNTPLAGDSDQANDTVVRGATTQYTLRVINNGPVSVTGAIVQDTPVSGLNCPAGNVVSCSSATAGACPAAPSPILISDLTAGVALGTLPLGAVVMLSFSCTVP